MIKSFLICDSAGFPFYSKSADLSIENFDPSIFSGLISAISTIGKKIFNEEIATINFGLNSKASIVVLSRDFFGINKKIFFVFSCEDEIDHAKIRHFTTNVLMETKNILKQDLPVINTALEEKIERIASSMEIFAK